MDMNLGAYQSAVEARLAAWDADDFGRRLWQKDPTLWFPEPQPEIVDRLGWLDLPAAMSERLDELASFSRWVHDQGVSHVVLHGMGGSSLAPEVYRQTFGNANGHPGLIVLDSTHPDQVRDVDDATDPSRTLWIVSSKSGTTLETLSGFRHSWSRASSALADPGKRFVAVTDPGSPLEALARERGFGHIFIAPPDVGGRYSALTVFGLVPAAAIGVDLERLLAGAARMAAKSGPGVPASQNPSLVLGAAMGEPAIAGRDKLTYHPTPGIRVFPEWLEQLVAESTGKDGRGIIPVAGEPAGGPYGEDRLFVGYAVDGEPPPPMGAPGISITLDDAYQLGAEMFRAEMATAAAGAILGIHPFNQPDVQLAKELARRAMETGERDGMPIESVPVDQAESALASFLAEAAPPAYVGFHAYLPRHPETTAKFDALRSRLKQRTGVATTLGYGPRFLHSTGQLHKGGPDTGIFIQIVNHPRHDMPVPETDFTFGRLIRAQADGDYRALVERGRRVLRIDLGEAPVATLHEVWPR